MTDTYPMLRALRTHLSDVQVFGGLDPAVGFEPFNPTHAEWPLARVECRTTDHVSAVVRIASDHRVPVSVCSGREDIYARNSRSGHLVLDLRHLADARFDKRSACVKVGGGVTTKMMLSALPTDVVTPTVTSANAGVVGAATGGGYGLLCGSFGLACDALVGAEVVLANGEAIIAGADDDDDLLWALRGGGTGFGIVTKARFATHRCGHMLSAEIGVPLHAASDALLMVQALLDQQPVNLALLPLLTMDERGEVTLILTCLWNGPEAEGHDIIAALAGLKHANLLDCGRKPYRDTLDDGSMWPWGSHWTFDTRLIARLTPDIVRRIIDLASAMPGPGCTIFFHDFHGRAASAAEADTAFRLRSDHFVMAATAFCLAGDDETAARQEAWIRLVATGMESLALPGGYINFLGPHEADRAEAFFGTNAARLRTLKRRYDPDDILQAVTGRFPSARE